MLVFFVSIEILVALLAFLNGLICLFNPNLAIKIQQKFYKRINWRIEPINLAKELRNTRIMGLISLILAITLTVYILK
ncbi:MAG: hypothetical protein ISS47_02220 [Candidatus Omnitrophica bacterium]|nr:hypothetical protein [Candidatus Omnitrophota bacterium]